jgi:hypothetical protein
MDVALRLSDQQSISLVGYVALPEWEIASGKAVLSQDLWLLSRKISGISS